MPVDDDADDDGRKWIESLAKTFRKQFWFITEIYRQKDKGHNCRIFVFAFRQKWLILCPYNYVPAY